MRTFDKPAIDIGEQIALLKARGLQIQDEKRARHFLEAVSFFRLTPYMRPFQLADDPQHGFRSDVGFRNLTRLYDFDRRLRLLVMDAVERVEVAARAVISNHMGPSRGVHWYLDARVFKRQYNHERLLNTVRDAGLAQDADRKAIARRLNLVAPLLESWLHTLTTIRNICAHHARLWNRELGIRPKLPEKPRFVWPEHLKVGTHKRMYPVLSHSEPHDAPDEPAHQLGPAPA